MCDNYVISTHLWELVQRVRTSVRMTPKVVGSNPTFPTTKGPGSSPGDSIIGNALRGEEIRFESWLSVFGSTFVFA
jgi:hypothetical protein